MPSVLSWINLADTAAEIAATRAAGGLGPRNLLTESPGEVWRIPPVAAGAPTVLDVTLASAQPVGVVALFAPRDGYLPPGYVLRLWASNVAPGGNDALTGATAAMDLPAGRGAWWRLLPAPVTARFWQFRFAAGSGDEYAQFGRLWIGPDFRPAIGAASAGGRRGVATAGTAERAAVSGALSAVRGATYRESRFTLPLLTDAEARAVETMALAVGTAGQVIANPRTGDGAESLLLGRLAAPPSPEIVGRRRWSATLTVAEEV